MGIIFWIFYIFSNILFLFSSLVKLQFNEEFTVCPEIDSVNLILIVALCNCKAFIYVCSPHKNIAFRDWENKVLQCSLSLIQFRLGRRLNRKMHFRLLWPWGIGLLLFGGFARATASTKLIPLTPVPESFWVETHLCLQAHWNSYYNACFARREGTDS